MTMAPKRNLRRAAVPAVVVAIAVAGAGVYPALASDGDPDLPAVTAEELVARIAASDTEQFSGSVAVDLGFDVPGLSGIAGAFGGPAGRLASLAAGDSALQIAVDGPDRQRLTIEDGSEELSVIHNGDDLWAYDSAGDVVYHSAVPEDAPGAGTEDPLGGLTPRQLAEEVLAEAEGEADVSVDGTARVAGRQAYQLLVEPVGENAEVGAGLGPGALDSVRIAVDAESGLPLAVTVNSDQRQLADVAFTRISYEKPSGGTFDFTPPQGAEVVEVDDGSAFTGLLPGSQHHD